MSNDTTKWRDFSDAFPSKPGALDAHLSLSGADPREAGAGASSSLLTLPDRAPVGDSSTIELRTLTPSILVRIRVPRHSHPEKRSTPLMDVDAQVDPHRGLRFGNAIAPWTSPPRAAPIPAKTHACCS